MSALPMHRSFASAVARICLTALLCSLVACALPQAREGEMRVFELAVTTPKQAPLDPQPQLLVDAPSASGLLDSDRIVVRAGPDELGLLRGGRWSEPLPQLWQRTLIRAIEDDGRLRAGRQRDVLAGDARLLGELRAFEFVRDQARVHVHFHAKRVGAGQRIVAARSFEASAEVRGSDAADVVVAFNTASHTLLTELLDWLSAAP